MRNCIGLQSYNSLKNYNINNISLQDALDNICTFKFYISRGHEKQDLPVMC